MSSQPDDNSPSVPASTQPAPSRSKTPLTSQKLGRTLKELESAFHEWESLGPVGAPAVPPAAPESSDVEFRTKTKKLLSQLREQLNELND